MHEVFLSECGDYPCRRVDDCGRYEAWTRGGEVHWRHDNRVRTWADSRKPRRPMAFCVGGYSATKRGQKRGTFTLCLLHCDTSKFIEPYRGNTVLEEISVTFRRKIPPQNVPHWITAAGRKALEVQQ